MKTASGTLISHLNDNTQFRMADLIEVQTASGTSRYSTGDRIVAYGGNSYSVAGPLMKRTGTRLSAGLETDTLKITVYASTAHLIEGLPFVQAALKGAIDSARIRVLRAFFDSSWAIIDAVEMFSGRVSNVSGTRSSIEIEVKSDVEVLAVQMPRHLVQPPCLNTLFDNACGLQRAAWQVSGSAASGSTTAYVTSSLAQAAGWFDQGTIRFTSGQNNGLRRTVKSFAAGRFDLIYPLPYAPAPGDTFVALPGCDKQQATCSGKFGNSGRLRSMPYVPAAEVALG